MLPLLQAILFTTCILAASPFPAHVQPSQPWIKFREDQSLARFQSTLLNETLLPFLHECYINHDSVSYNGESKTEEITCSRYFDAVLQLNSTDYVVSAPAVGELLNQVNLEKKFCEQNHTFPTIKYFTNAVPIDFNNSAVCGRLCLDDDLAVPKPIPICRFLVWLGEQIKTSNGHTQSVGPAPVVASARAVSVDAAPVPPQVIPVIVDSSTQTVGADKNEKTPAADVNVENPALPPTNIQTVHAPSDTSSQTKKKNIPLIQPPIVDEKNSTKTIPASVATEDPKQSKPLDGDKPSIDSDPKQNPNTQEEIPLIPPTSNNADKPVSIEKLATNNDQQSYNESEEDINEAKDIGGEFGLKSKDVPFEEPDDIEHDQKSSQEIIDNNNNYVHNTNNLADPFLEESGSNFFTYFLIGMFLCIALYVIYHNKSKILALLLEGRRGDKGRGGRRKHTAAYRKLDSNLEEAITSSASGRTTQIIY